MADFENLTTLDGIEAATREVIVCVCNAGGYAISQTAHKAVKEARKGNWIKGGKNKYRLYRCDDSASLDSMGTVYASTKLDRIGEWHGR